MESPDPDLYADYPKRQVTGRRAGACAVGAGSRYRAPEPDSSPPGSELAVAAARSLDPHQVKLVEACRRGHEATGEPAFAAAAETVTGLHA